MIRVKTYKGENDKWYVEVVKSDNAGQAAVGERLNANDSINEAIFDKPTKGCDLGFESRRLAREYLRAYINDAGNDVKGGLH